MEKDKVCKVVRVKTDAGVIRIAEIKKKYEQFLKRIFSFDDFSQAYDILYFRSGELRQDSIMTEIEKGEVLYERAA